MALRIGHTHHEEGVYELTPLKGFGPDELWLWIQWVAPYMIDRSIVDDVSGFKVRAPLDAMTKTERLP
jgi:hypothetical protein